MLIPLLLKVLVIELLLSEVVYSFVNLFFDFLIKKEIKAPIEIPKGSQICKFSVAAPIEVPIATQNPNLFCVGVSLIINQLFLIITKILLMWQPFFC